MPNQVLVLNPLCHVLERLWRPRVDLDGEEGDEGAGVGGGQGHQAQQEKGAGNPV